MIFTVRPIAVSDAEAICTWRYPEPYAVYNGTAATVAALLDPDYHYCAVFEEAGELVGFFCYGADARVPGELAGEDPDDATLDVGLGLRPDLTGQGLGSAFVEAGLAYARETFAPHRFRLAVLTFNRRAIVVYERSGFHPVRTFVGPSRQGDREYLRMERDS